MEYFPETRQMNGSNDRFSNPFASSGFQSFVFNKGIELSAATTLKQFLMINHNVNVGFLKRVQRTES